MNSTDQAAALIEIETETRTVEANGWVEAGDYHTASFRGMQPENVRGCPLGRSQHSAAAAVADLLRRTNDESGTSYTAAQVTVTRHNGQPIAPPTPPPSAPVGDYQGSHDTQPEAAAHCSRLIGGGIYQEQDGRWHVWSTSNPAARTWNESPAFSSLDDSEPFPETEEAAAQSADQLAAIAGRKAAEALDAYTAALNHAAAVANDNNRPAEASACITSARLSARHAGVIRTDAARLA